MFPLRCAVRYTRGSAEQQYCLECLYVCACVRLCVCMCHMPGFVCCACRCRGNALVEAQIASRSPAHEGRKLSRALMQERESQSSTYRRFSGQLRAGDGQAKESFHESAAGGVSTQDQPLREPAMRHARLPADRRFWAQTGCGPATAGGGAASVEPRRGVPPAAGRGALLGSCAMSQTRQRRLEGLARAICDAGGTRRAKSLMCGGGSSGRGRSLETMGRPRYDDNGRAER